jgi:hypothetical protein
MRAPHELQNFDAGASGAPQLGHHALAVTNGIGAAGVCGDGGTTGNPAPGVGGALASSFGGVSVFDILGSLLMSMGTPEEGGSLFVASRE